MILTLTRDLSTPQLTLGTLIIGGHKLHTIERPWIPNPDGGKSGKRFESCVSVGEYRLEAHHSEKFATAWALVNRELDVYHWPDDVPKGKEARSRVAILIHSGNYVRDVVGCIAPGRARSKLDDGWMVAQSRDAMNIIKTVIGTSLDVRLVIA